MFRPKFTRRQNGLWWPSLSAGPWRFNPCADCCTRLLNCVDCSFAIRPDSWIVDVGVGGWIDSACNYCDQISGQYTLDDYINLCEWRYGPIPNVCTTVPWGWTPDFYIILWLQWVGETNWRVMVNVVLHYHDLVYSSARYRTDATLDIDCWHFGGQGPGDKITLTKFVADTHANALCSGSMPNTIEAWAP